MTESGSPISKELDYFRRHLQDWEGHEGEYVLIKGEKAVDFFSSYDDALKRGYREFGLESFLVKQISVVECASFISRSIVPCHISL
ncbi:MAG: hypothetical protein OXF74_07090 [Rhodobacteraceae bacterium]|nr:hypothetical protein [Paracoccaceae bacterium]